MTSRHLPGGLKQQNKPFKSRHATKTSLKRRGGKTAPEHRPSLKSKHINPKSGRRKVTQTQSRMKREELLFSKQLGSSVGAPRIVGIIPLSTGADATVVLNAFKQHVGVFESPVPGPITIHFPSQNTRITFIVAEPTMGSVLDVAKVADILLTLIFEEQGIDELGQTLISGIKAQGLPSVLSLIHGLSAVPKKQLTQRKKFVQNQLSFHFAEFPRMLPFDTDKDVTQIIRFLCTTRVRKLTWRERSYILTSSLSFEPIPIKEGQDEKQMVLCASGYLRGGNLSANDLIHIPDFGDYQILKIEGPPDPNPFPGRSSNEDPHVTVLEVPDPELQEDLITEMIPDTLLNEQTWDPEDDRELLIAESKSGKERLLSRLLAEGTSEAQAAWELPLFEEEQANLVTELREEEGMAVEESFKRDDQIEGKDDLDVEEIDMEAAEKERERLRKEEQDDLDYPDEVEVPTHMKAKIRFNKYRGLRSFRTSQWDINELLPIDYARIFRFENFRTTRKQVLGSHTGVQPGEFVSVYINAVPMALLDTINANHPLILSGLYKYEHKLSVAHFTIQRHHSYDLPIQSKEPLLFSCGFRRFMVRPLFSTNTHNCDKFKYDRFLQLTRGSYATIYAPVMFSPCPMLAFKPPTDEGSINISVSSKNLNGWNLVARGSLDAINPDRLIVKRIILTGYPTKIHKRNAVVRYMFNHPEDIQWFKPVELWTKYGKVGNIVAPLGTHGLMKCRFSQQIANHDTVCLSLYKRVFPKYGATQLLAEIK